MKFFIAKCSFNQNHPELYRVYIIRNPKKTSASVPRRRFIISLVDTGPNRICPIQKKVSKGLLLRTIDKWNSELEAPHYSVDEFLFQDTEDLTVISLNKIISPSKRKILYVYGVHL